MLDETLCQIGFTRSEARVYTTLFQIGPQAGSVIAKKTELNRSTAYTVLKSLQKKGIVSTYKKNNIQYFVACDPNLLVGYIDRQCKTFDYFRAKILQDINLFRGIIGDQIHKKPVVTFFDGIEGMKNVLCSALYEHTELYAYLSVTKWLKLGFEDFLKEYRDLRVMELEIPLNIMTPDTPEVRAFFHDYKKGTNLTRVFYVNDDDFNRMCEHDLLIYGDKVAIIYLDRGCENAVVLDNPRIANMQKAIFRMICKDSRVKLSVI